MQKQNVALATVEEGKESTMVVASQVYGGTTTNL